MASFHDEIKTALMNPHKQKPYKESSVKPVISQLVNLNKKKPLTSLDFLLDRETIDQKLETYAPSTRRVILFSIVNVAKDMGRDDILNLYQEDAKAGEVRRPVGIKTDKQEENWLTWDDVVAKRKEFEEKEDLSDSDQKKLLLLSLYTMFPPRRNMDYIDMVVTDRMPGKKPTKMNYMVVMKTKMRMVFEVYKTAGAYGRQVFDVPEDMRKAVLRFLKTQHWTDEKNRALLGAGLHSNYITRMLNEVFAPKRISSSMLRHIYASSKYGGAEHQEALAEMMDDADKMAHSIGTQQLVYAKKN
jgi:hypothetical protein